MYVYQYQYKQHYKYHAIKCYEHFYIYCNWLQMSVKLEQGTCIWNVIINSISIKTSRKNIERQRLKVNQYIFLTSMLDINGIINIKNR